MEEAPSVSSAQDAGSQQHESCKASHVAGDDVGDVDDPPPIPSAGLSSRGSVHLNDQLCDEARETDTTNSIVTADLKDGDTVHSHAHTWSHATVASVLATDTRYVKLLSLELNVTS